MVYTLITRAETPKHKRKQWKNSVVVSKQPHGLISLTKEEYTEILAKSGRKKPLKVKYNGKTYPALALFGKRSGLLPRTANTLGARQLLVQQNAVKVTQYATVIKKNLAEMDSRASVPLQRGSNIRNIAVLSQEMLKAHEAYKRAKDNF
jgi:hypothetical protein